VLHVLAEVDEVRGPESHNAAVLGRLAKKRLGWYRWRLFPRGTRVRRNVEPNQRAQDVLASRLVKTVRAVVPDPFVNERPSRVPMFVG
jgi:hypothetical protein